ncbi:MAG: lytic transglycosylase [Saprospiraceae bacterium]|nr:MAG: lytic transglycosylase [Saprospiraceae bacterium]
MLATVVVLALLCCNPAKANGQFDQSLSASGVWPIDQKIIIQNLCQLVDDFPVLEEQMILNKVESYLIRAKPSTEKMLGRAGLYLPIFEHYLALNGMPDFLKFLPVAESRLKPTVVSSCGAAGLWQFMPATGRHYGLRVNDYVDERLAPYKATEAAVEMLSELYYEFDDWALALAAYNCGPERVAQALKASSCSSYWDIRHLLPRQTQQYIPSFLAAVYVGTYYARHQLRPKTQRWQDDFRVVPVYRRLSFRKISGICRLPIAYLEQLNPAYFQGIIPKGREAYYLILPASAAQKLQVYLQKKRQLHKKVVRLSQQPEGIQTRYIVGAGDCLDTIAHRFQCRPTDIINWNNLQEKTLQVHQELIVYLDKEAVFGHFWYNC